MKIRIIAVFISLIVLAGCEPAAGRTTTVKSDSVAPPRSDSIARERQDSINRARPDYIIDSLLPIDEEIRRFRNTVGGTAATALSGGAPSRDSLLRLFVIALERRDTATLVRAIITPREFIDLYYESSPYTRPPYRQPPGLVWSQMSLASSKGISRLMERRGGAPLGPAGLRCETEVQQGSNRILNGCEVRLRSGSERLFGSIIARDGVFKFLSYANAY